VLTARKWHGDKKKYDADLVSLQSHFLAVAKAVTRRECGGGLPGFSFDPFAGQSFLSEPDGVSGGLFHDNPDAGEGSVDWPWLEAQEAVDKRGCVWHLRFREPLLVVMNGKAREGMIFKA